MSNIEEVISYTFTNKTLLYDVLQDFNGINYQRLEFLGDSVLSMIIAEQLFTSFVNEDEECISRRHIALVCGETLTTIANKIGLSKYITKNNVQIISDRSLENTLEALIAAIYLDGGMINVQRFIMQYWHDLLHNVSLPPKNTKNSLQEFVQARSLPLPYYEITDKQGPDHKPMITVRLHIQGYKDIYTTANSRRAAEFKAAGLMLQQFTYKEKQDV